MREDHRKPTRNRPRRLSPSGPAAARSRPVPSWCPAPISTPTRSSRPTAARWRGCSGTIRTCRGTAPSCGSRRSTADGRLGARDRGRRRADESIFQPEWSPDGVLLLRVRSHRLVEPLSRARRRERRGSRQAVVEPLHPMPAEFGKPQWTLHHGDLCVCRRAAASRRPSPGRTLEAGALIETDPVRCRTARAGRVEAARGAARATSAPLYFIGGSPTARIFGHADDSSRRWRPRCCARRRASRSIRAWISVAEARHLHGRRTARGACVSITRRHNPDFAGAGRHPAAAAGDHPRRADRRDRGGARLRRSSSGPAAGSPCSTSTTAAAPATAAPIAIA